VKYIVSFASLLTVSVCLMTSVGVRLGAAQPRPIPTQPGRHIIVALTGTVKVKRKNWNKRVDILARKGMWLQMGDLLDIRSNATVRIVCADRKVKQLSTGLRGVPCPAAVRGPVDVDGLLHGPVRGGDSFGLEYPMLVSPRMGKLLNPRPKLRWTPVLGATRYTVLLEKRDGSQIVIYKGPRVEISYPAGAPALSPADRLVVSSESGRSSDEEERAGLGFNLVTARERQALLKAQHEIRSLNLPAAQTQVLLAILYASKDFYTEAVDILEKLAQSSTEPAVLQLLGDLYLKMGLSRHAEKHYLRAVTLARNASDADAEAQARRGLALVYEAIGNAAEATDQWQKALDFYRGVEDDERIRQIESHLNALQRN